MRVQTGLKHPLGLTLLTVSALLAMLLAVLPQSAEWSARAGWLVAFGLLAYLATAGVVLRVRPRPSGPVRELWKIRDAMAARLAEMRAERGSSALISIVAEAISHLDVQMLPALEQLVVRHASLTRELERYERGVVPAPDPAVMERLRAIHGRQQQAIAACIQQAANAQGILVALTQEADEATVVKDVQEWVTDLQDLWLGIVEALGEESGVP